MNRKKYYICIFLVLLIVTLSACSGGSRVQYLGNASEQMSDDNTEMYLFFALSDANKKEISSDGTADVRIVNENGDEVYSGQFNFTGADFSDYINAIGGEMHLCRLAIPMSEVKTGSSSSGTIYFKVYKENVYEFEEMSTSIYLDLPIAQATLTLVTEVPTELNAKGWRGEVDTTVKITEVNYSIDSYSGKSMEVYFNGEKTFDSEGESHAGECRFGYKVTDKEGYVVDTGHVWTNELKVGEKFKDESTYVSGLTPGEEYFIELFDYE